MRILKKITVYVLQFYLTVFAVLGIFLGVSWTAFKTGFSDLSSSFLDRLTEWK